MSKTFSEHDKGLMTIKMAVAAVKTSNKMLNKYGKLTPKLPVSVPHSLFYGPGGTGKTRRVEEAVKIMGCTEKDKTFFRKSPNSVEKLEEFIEFLQQNLSWQGYLQSDGEICKGDKPAPGTYIVDPVNPRGPVKNIAVFIDEVHDISKSTQERLGMVILDFRYDIPDKDGGFKTVFFPKFTLFAATTKPGDLLKPLRTRFGNKISVPYYTDSEMRSQVLESMLSLRGWKLGDTAKDIIAKISQGIARECDNHLTGLYNCWRFMISSGQTDNKYAIMEEVAREYIRIQGFRDDGLHLDQVRVLQFLSTFVTADKVKGVGVKRMGAALGFDEQRFADELEPRLVDRGYITSGGRGREITKVGLDYIQSNPLTEV